MNFQQKKINGMTIWHNFNSDGKITGILPAGLKEPTRCWIANPMGCDDNEQKPNNVMELNEMFEAYNVDAAFISIDAENFLANSVEQTIKTNLSKQFVDLVECQSGVLIAVWDLNDKIIIGGIDSGGSDFAETIVGDFDNNKIHKAHFDPETIVEVIAHDHWLHSIMQ